MSGVPLGFGAVLGLLDTVLGLSFGAGADFGLGLADLGLGDGMVLS
jgi:hypothetical protein